MQIVVNELDKLVPGLLVARAPAVQEGGNGVRITRFLHIY